MATSVPLSFKPQQVPVTPPPDHHTFNMGPLPPHLARADLGQGDFARAAYEATGLKPPQVTAPTSQPQPSPSEPATPGVPPATTTLPADPAIDPRYLAMASRIASYYQQRCQAIANFQQQRCQAWANMHRQKYQEMMQAAMLVVAWYIRDRISRRRKRQRRSFKRGLKQKSRNDGNRISKGESVRRWVMDVPLGATASSPPVPSTIADLRDEEEKIFGAAPGAAPEKEDKDAHLFTVADNLIKSQLTRIDLPLLGVLSFDESDDSDSEDEENVKYNGYEEEDNYEQQGDEDMDDYDDEDEYDDSGDFDENVTGSKSVHLGTSRKESRKRSSSCLS